MLNSIESYIWRQRLPSEVKERYHHLRSDFEALKTLYILPEFPHKIADIGSGSGAGSESLNTIFPSSSIYAIDNAVNWQNYLYSRRKPPSYIHFESISSEQFSQSRQNQFDIVVAARWSIELPFEVNDSWSLKASYIGKNLALLSSLLTKEGVLLISTPRHDSLGISRLLNANILISKLFISEQRFEGSDDDWSILQGVKTAGISAALIDPSILLTEFAKSTKNTDPYEIY